jgi:hypothetical protein
VTQIANKVTLLNIYKSIGNHPFPTKKTADHHSQWPAVRVKTKVGVIKIL